MFTLFSLACGNTHVAAPYRAVTLAAPPVMEAYRALRSASGPTRFTQVTPRLYRGGQPTAAQLARLHELGVRTVINLRTSKPPLVAEAVAAKQLGMRFYSFPLSGFSAPDPQLLHQIVDVMHDEHGAVYVHCHAGRDRTSLVVALYRVWVEHWPPALAWQHEARDFGHSKWLFFFRMLDRTFYRLTATS